MRFCDAVRHHKRYTLSAVYAALGTSHATVTRYLRRRERYDVRLEACARLVDAYRREHPGGGLVKVYRYLRDVACAPEVAGISRERFVAGMQARGRITELPRAPHPKTTRAGRRPFRNLTRGLVVTRPDQVWVSDTTYYAMRRGAWAYLTFVVDVYTRCIVGYAASGSLKASANAAAVAMAIERRGVARLRGQDVGLILHSDGGGQYGAREVVEALRAVAASSSMGFVAQENAFAERINGTIKGEFLRHWPASRRSLDQLTSHLARAVTTYNAVRLHDGLPGRLSPERFEARLARGERFGYEVVIEEWNHDPYDSTAELAATQPRE